MAAKDTPSMTKNKIRRSLVAILDPHPTAKEADNLWLYFNNSCAYCSIPIERSSRTGHLDHVVSSTLGGGNDIHNLVLSCAKCNGDEKREEDWENFLKRKAPTQEIAAARKAHIVAWLAKASPRILDTKASKQAEAIIQVAVANYEQAVSQIRALRKGSA